MKLLLDENIPPHLAKSLADLYPDSIHVHACGLGGADDGAVWEYAKHHQCTILSKDSDFAERTVLAGSPPKVIWVRIGNCTTSELEMLLRAAHDRIMRFIVHSDETCLLLTRRRTPE